MNNFYTYLIIIPKTNKKYVGITNNLNKRIYDHFYYANKHLDDNRYFYNSLRKYECKNMNDIRLYILDINYNKDDACNSEKYFISYYKSNDKRFGYNLTNGGEICVLNEEVKNKISKSKIGKKRYDIVGDNNQSKKQYVRDKISKNRKGKCMGSDSPMNKYKHLRDNAKKRWLKTNNPNYGKPINNKLLNILKDKNSSIWEITYPNGDIKIVKNLTEWCSSNNIHYGSCRVYVKRNKPYKGYLIKKVEDNYE